MCTSNRGLVNQIYVSLDLETTGLDPKRDRIIEIGVVKFQGKEVLDTFHTLVNPRHPLTYYIRLLTGITPKELETAPLFSAVSAELVAFIGSYPIVGQNITFDLNFLGSQGVTFPNTTYDVREVASILLPQLQNHSLPMLAKQLEVSYEVHHRALDDAIAAKEVFLALLDKASQLDLRLIAEINRLTMTSNWSWRSFFLELEGARMGNVSLWDRGDWEADFVPHMDLAQRNPLVSDSIAKPLDLSWLSSLLGEHGHMAKTFPAFEYRPGQVSMMQAVAGALNNGQHLIVEAGTGIGKSIAYLLPAIFFALENNTHIIISTNTINLQEQLINKDIPDLLQALGRVKTHLNSNLQVAQLKGRTNYLCLRQWNSRRKSPRLPWEEVRFLLRLLVWLSSTSTGDRAELNLSGNEVYLWKRICASDDNCVIEHCPYYPSSCFLYRARHKTEEAHLVVVNHALLLSDLVKSRGILPEYSHLIIDEAHHLEEEATERLGYQISQQDIRDYLDHFGDRGGLVFRLRNYLRTTSIAALRRREIEQRIEGVEEQVKIARTRLFRLFEVINYFIHLQPEERGEYERWLRLTQEVRTQPGWAEVEVCWENLNLELGGIEGGLSELYTMLEDLPHREDLNTSLAEISSLRQQLWGLRSQTDSIIAGPEASQVYWFSSRGQGNLYLHAAPLHVGQVLEKSLFSQKDCIVLTSATLSTEGNFEYVKSSLGLREAKELVIDAPFDYMASALIYLPRDIPEPDKASYQPMVEQSLVELVRTTRGRTLALFTSRAALGTTYAVVKAPLEEEGILVLGQGIDGSPKQLLNNFKANPRSLLLGTASLWEGIDVVGKVLSVLVIARLPFSVPTDPVFSARSELFEDPFNQYAIPQAALKFKQGFGRLIRSRDDRGVMVVLDRRLQSKPYGGIFLQSLPKCTVKSGSLKQMPQEVVEWLGD